MSRIGKKPIAIPAGVTVSVQGNTVTVKGPKGELSHEVPGFVTVQVVDGRVELACRRADKEGRAIHGTNRSLLANMVKGVHEGYSRDLEIHGVGFRASVQGRKLVLSLGYSHPIEYEPPEGIAVKVVENTGINVSGPDKRMVGDVSARIRSFFPPEPYKGKGIRYKGQYVRRKVGKTVA